MQPKSFTRNLGQIYLSLFIPLGILLGLALGRLNYQMYLPICLINACLVTMSGWILGAHAMKSQDVEKKHLVFIASCLIVPWALIFLFCFLGPPPDGAEFVATATEQKVRYAILIVSGILITLGLGGLREKLKTSGEDFYSTLGFTAMMIAIPLYIIQMSFYSNFTFELFKIQLASSSEKYPEWFLPVLSQFQLIGIVEVALTYLATAAFAASLKSAGWFRKTPANIYITISLVAFLLVAFYPLFANAVRSFGFFPLLIPAVPFIIPLYMGINLLRRAGTD